MLYHPILIEFSDLKGLPCYYFFEGDSYLELENEVKALSIKYKCAVNWTEFQTISAGAVPAPKGE